MKLNKSWKNSLKSKKSKKVSKNKNSFDLFEESVDKKYKSIWENWNKNFQKT